MPHSRAKTDIGFSFEDRSYTRAFWADDVLPGEDLPEKRHPFSNTKSDICIHHRDCQQRIQSIPSSNCFERRSTSDLSRNLLWTKKISTLKIAAASFNENGIIMGRKCLPADRE